MKKLNKTFNISFQKLDQLIGLPPPIIYSKHGLHGPKTSLTNLQTSFTIQKRSHINTSSSQKKLTPSTSNFKLRHIKNEKPSNSSLTPSEKRRIFLAKCEDLKIPPVPQMEKRFYDYIERVSKNRVLILNEKHLGKASADVLGKILKTSFAFSRLELSKNNLGDEGIEVLTNYIQFNKSLIHIDLSSNDIKPEGAVLFFKMLEKHESVISLEFGSKDGLNKNKLGTIGSAPLREVLKNNLFLIFLSLTDCQIGPEGLGYISEGLISNRVLECLNLSHNFLTSKSLKNFFYSIKNSNITELVLSHNKIGNEGAKIIGKFFTEHFRTIKIKSLSLDNNEITHKGANQFFTGIVQNTSLGYLNLKNNPMTELAGSGIFYFIDENVALGYLNLSACKLRENGIDKLAEGLTKNRTIKTLVLKNNHMKDPGVVLLADILARHPTLLNLDLAKNQITSKGASVLFAKLKANTILYSLNLRDNQLKDDIAELIIDYTRSKGNLQVLKLEDNLITSRYLEKIAENLEKNKNKYRDIVSNDLRTHVKRLSLADFSTHKIKAQITLKAQEKEKIESRLQFHQDNVEEVRRNLKRKMDEVFKQAEETKKLSNKVSQELGELEYNIAIEKNRYQVVIGKIERDISAVDRELEEMQINCKK